MLTPHQLSDHLEIQSLGYRFADAANRRDHAAFAALWTDDGLWQIGDPINVRFEGKAVIAQAIGELLGRWDFFVQLPHAPVIELTGNRATARWTMQEVARTRDKSRGNYNLSLYHDELVRVQGHWLFKTRLYQTLYVDETPLPGQTFPAGPEGGQ